MYYDCHTHTCFSKDAQTKTPQMACESALKMGLYGIAFTEHADLRHHEKLRCLDDVEKGLKVVETLKKEYEGRLKVFTGVELADISYFPELLKKTIGFCDYDVLLCSVHLTEYKGKYIDLSLEDFSHTPQSELYKIISTYYEDLRKSLYCENFNILCHLTYPLRYFNAKFGKNICLDRYMGLIEDIFKIAIDKNTALEINTAKVTDKGGEFCPDESFIRLYKSLGGTLFTLGSDSHTVGTEANMFYKACDMLKSLSIDKCCYFEKRKPVFYNI